MVVMLESGWFVPKRLLIDSLTIYGFFQEVVKNQDFQMWTLEGLEEQMIRLRTSVNDLNQVLDNWRDSHIFHMQSIQHETFEGQNEIDLVRARRWLNYNVLYTYTYIHT